MNNYTSHSQSRVLPKTKAFIETAVFNTLNKRLILKTDLYPNGKHNRSEGRTDSTSF